MGRDRPTREYLEGVVQKQDIREARAIQEDALVGTPIICRSKDGAALAWQRMNGSEKLVLRG